MSDAKNHNVGDQVKVTSNTSGHQFKIGSTVLITEHCGNHYGGRLTEGQDGDQGTWYFGDHEVETIDTTLYNSSTLTVSFTDEVKDRSKARAYLKNATSRLLTADENAVLKAAAKGETVNLRDLQKALHSSLRAALTRYEASPRRRQAGSEISHLQYIIGGVLDNHLDGLPVVTENGPHSPALKAAREALTEARTATTLAEEKTLQVAAERDALQARAVRAENHLDVAETKATRRAAQITNLETALVEAAPVADLLTYAMGMLTVAQRERLEGFKDALTR